MWGRPQRSETSTKSGTAPAIRSIDDLLKPAEWDRSSDDQRAQAAISFAPLEARANHADSLLHGAAPVQAWIAGVVGPHFQPYIAAGVQDWLTIAPAAAHLYVGGSTAYGVPQLIATMARQQVANWPTPASYCYAPDPTELDRALLLTLPLGTGKAFGKGLADALEAIGKQWDDAASRQTTMAARFDALQGAPPAAQDYLARLRAAIADLAATDTPLPWRGKDAGPPLGAVLPEPDAKGGAPVVDGTTATDPTSLLLQANGGVLILSAASVDAAKLLPLLAARELAVSPTWPAVPLTTRVVLIGTSSAHETLWKSSEIIEQLFRYELWAQGNMFWNPGAEATYAVLANGVAAYYALPAPSPTAVGRLIQEGARRVGGLNRSYLSTDILELHDIIVEAGNFARVRSAAAITGEDVEAAIDQRIAHQRASNVKTQDMILSGHIITPTTGSAIGQINGLSVYELHPWEGSFGVPLRISATASAGRDEQFIDIERESENTDDSHVLGLLTMVGYFTNQYGQKFPLSLAARLRFEQKNNGSRGDSASAAELFALLSALSGIPIRRSLAVTGAVGQYGEIQPIGGVNFKIEGFWDLCRTRRAQGEQSEGGYGVIIPAANAQDLMLRPTVATSIASEGWFNVWLAQTVDDALPLLMGVAAATVHEKVEQRLRLFHLQAKSSNSSR